LAKKDWDNDSIRLHKKSSLRQSGTYAKIREKGRYVTKALFIVVGGCIDGYREILGAKLADSESYWTLVFDELKKRDISDVQFVISDGHKGIQCF